MCVWEPEPMPSCSTSREFAHRRRLLQTFFTSLSGNSTRTQQMLHAERWMRFAGFSFVLPSFRNVWEFESVCCWRTVVARAQPFRFTQNRSKSSANSKIPLITHSIAHSPSPFTPLRWLCWSMLNSSSARRAIRTMEFPHTLSTVVYSTLSCF